MGSCSTLVGSPELVRHTTTNACRYVIRLPTHREAGCVPSQYHGCLKPPHYYASTVSGPSEVGLLSSFRLMLSSQVPGPPEGLSKNPETSDQTKTDESEQNHSGMKFRGCGAPRGPVGCRATVPGIPPFRTGSLGPPGTMRGLRFLRGSQAHSVLPGLCVAVGSSGDRCR